MDLAKVKVGNLCGKSNWAVWKFKVSMLLKGLPNAWEVVDGTLTEPVAQTPPPQGVADPKPAAVVDDDVKQRYATANSAAMIVILNNLADEDIQKIMRFPRARDAWQELHRLFDGTAEDKSFDLCSQFFSYKRDENDDLATHLSKLKNLWNQLKLEIKIGENCTCALPDVFLMCKILETLPNEYFSFKSSWLLMGQNRQND